MNNMIKIFESKEFGKVRTLVDIKRYLPSA